MRCVHSLCGPAIPTGLNEALAFLSVGKKGRYDYLNSSRGTTSLSVFFPPTYCRSVYFCETFSSFVMPSQSSLSINCTSFFLFILSLYSSCPSLITRLFTLHSSILCPWYVCVEERTRDRKAMRDGRARLLRWRRGTEVSRPLLTGAKWSHIVPLSDHLSF